MSDAIAKREARRKKILENSQNRLKKITGRDEPNLFENFDTNGKENSQNCPLERTPFEDPLVKLLDDQQQVDDDVTKHSTNNTSHNEFQRISPSLIEDNNSHHDTTTKYFLNGDMPSNFDDDDDKSPSSSSCASSLNTYDLLTSRLSYILLAALVNILLIGKLDHLYGNSVVVPCLIIVITRLCFLRVAREASEGNLLMAALLLSNIKPDLVYKTKKSMTMLNTIAYDLALYIFCFTLMRWCVLYIDDNLSSVL